jgi:cbb3-type cytochrome oxidase subunit 3
MSAAGLSSWAELGLIISFITFTAVAAWVLFRRSASWDRARYLPLEDDEPNSGDPR